MPIGEDKIFDADEMVALAHQVIETKDREGNCVIVGRGAPYILTPAGRRDSRSYGAK